MALGAYEVHMAAVVTRAIIPRGVLGGVSDGDEVGARAARWIDRSTIFPHLILRAGLWVLWLWPLLSRRPRLFSGLSPDEQARLVERVAGARSYALREMVMLVKMNACFAALGEPAALSALRAYDSAAPAVIRRAS
jgi:hypothetical protein